MAFLAKTLHLGRALYWGYYRPKGIIHKYWQRDPIRRSIDEQSRLAMERAAYQLLPLSLPPLPLPNVLPTVHPGAANPPSHPPITAGDRPAEIYFLSGARFWYQTCFCAYSMMQQAQMHLRPVIYDDGTLEPAHHDAFLRLFSDVQIVSVAEIEERLERDLPAAKFPQLRSRRLHYPNLRKLTDIHIGSQGWKLVLDSDMLFFRKPTFLLDWLRSPQTPCHMVDVSNAYGYSDALMSQLTQTPIPDQINVGICGLQSDRLDWEELEYWCHTLIEREQTNYYQEQALIAMLMARSERAIAPANDYIVLPSLNEVRHPRAVLHHYVADSKPWYFRYGWKHVVSHSAKGLA